MVCPCDLLLVKAKAVLAVCHLLSLRLGGFCIAEWLANPALAAVCELVRPVAAGCELFCCVHENLLRLHAASTDIQWDPPVLKVCGTKAV
jgi:hypothetical protein